MFRFMIDKDIASLAMMLDDGFVLVHMTGMRQTKVAYLSAIADGTLNYFKCSGTHLTMQVQGDKARLIGKSHVSAAVFGGGRHTWPLQLDITLSNKSGRWLMTEAVASTF